MNDVKRKRLGFARSLVGAAMFGSAMFGSAMFGSAMLGGAMLGGALLAAGCETTTTATLYTPYTGLAISSAAVFAGYSCGLGAGQVYAYVAVVSDASEAGPQPTGLPTFNVYACGDNGAFQNLPGSGFYNVNIYAYDRASFPASLACTSVNCTPPSTVPSDLGTPTWTTTCTGIEEPSINALVQCQPLTPTSVTAIPDATAPQGPDGGAAADAGTLDATLDSDGGTSDGAADAVDGAGEGGPIADDGGTGSDGADDDADTGDASDASDGS